eukprot:9000521-Alexandrium_andersonii.AAC.1
MSARQEDTANFHISGLLGIHVESPCEMLAPPGGAYIASEMAAYFSQSPDFDFRLVRGSGVFDESCYASVEAGFGATSLPRPP